MTITARATQKKALDAGGNRPEGEDQNPYERKPIMSSVQIADASLDAAPLSRTLQAHADRIRTQIMEISAQRQATIQNAVETLRKQGVDARAARHISRKAPQRGIVCESYGFHSEGTPFHSVDFLSPRPSTPSLGAVLVADQLIIWHGTFELLFADSRTAVVVRVPDVDDEEGAHRRSVSRLRTAARHEGMRVAVRDRAVSLLDPMDAALHTGTVITALAFLAGIDLTHPVEEPRP